MLLAMTAGGGENQGDCIRSSEYPGRFMLPAFAGTGLAGMTKEEG